MKKLLLIAITGLSLFIGASFADDISAFITPVTQQGISGTTAQFTLNVVNHTGVTCNVMQVNMQHPGVSTLSSWIPLILAQVPGSTNWQTVFPMQYLFQVGAGQTGTLQMTGNILLSSRNVLDINGTVVVKCGTSVNLATFAITGAQILPVADLQITKTIVGNLPYFSGNSVDYIITVENI